MHRTNIYLSDDQRDALDERARAEGMSRAELVRQLVDRGLARVSDPSGSHLAAIIDSFGALGDEEFVLDRGDGVRGAHLERIARQ